MGHLLAFSFQINTLSFFKDRTSSQQFKGPPSSLLCCFSSICVLRILLLLVHPPPWQGHSPWKPQPWCVLGSWIRSCAEHLRGLHWCGSLSNVGGGVLESGKQPAEFHKPTPGSLLSAFQGTNGCGWTVVRTLGSPAQPTYQLFAIICLHACVCS